MHHVTSTLNRPSIQANGLDVRLMGPALGIAGSQDPEIEGFAGIEHPETALFGCVPSARSARVKPIQALKRSFSAY